MELGKAYQFPTRIYLGDERSKETRDSGDDDLFQPVSLGLE